MGRPRKNLDRDVMVAIDDGVVVLNGHEEIVHKGISRAHRGAEIVRLYPTLWKPIDVHFEVEQMTAAPGELRGS